MFSPNQLEPPPALLKEARDRPRPIGDIWQWLGMSGDALGTGGTLRKTFFYAYAFAAAILAAIDTINVITLQHDRPNLGLVPALIDEGSSGLSMVLFFWIVWIFYRMAPPGVRPRWHLLLHIPGALTFSLAHVGGFILLRKIAYHALGTQYAFGSFVPHFLYEFRKDIFVYLLFIAGCALTEHLLRQQRLIETPSRTFTFDIRDGAKLTRVSLSDLLAVSSAGNYVEFVLGDGRRLLMRRPLSAIEGDLGDRGFVRTHRSWLVNAARVTGLSPEGSGDYCVALGALKVPLSRRFPTALGRLRQGEAQKN